GWQVTRAPRRTAFRSRLVRTTSGVRLLRIFFEPLARWFVQVRLPTLPKTKERTARDFAVESEVPAVVRPRRSRDVLHRAIVRRRIARGRRSMCAIRRGTGRGSLRTAVVLERVRSDSRAGQGR